MGKADTDRPSARRDAAAIYGSGGFTSYDDARLERQRGGWVREDGSGAVKMKIGSDPSRDPERVAAVGDDSALFVDANGAFSPRGALRVAARLSRRRPTRRP